MGIRVRKCIGWGTNDFNLKDPEAFDEKLETLHELTPQEWLAWISSHEDEITERYYIDAKMPHPTITPRHIRMWLKHDELKLERPGYCYAHDPEFGLENTILFWPFHMAHKCNRRDDLIDWFEEGIQLREHGESVRFVTRECGIYPYEKGEVPYSVIGMCIFLGIEDVIPKLKEALYVYWA